MAGRGLAFADPEVVRTLQTAFVPATGDDWYRRRQKDAVGDFFRKVADQSPRKGEGGSTRQGLYCFTADGELLAYRNSFDPDAVKALLKQALDKWQGLSDATRKPKPFKADKGKADPQFDRAVPEGALVIRVHARELERDGNSYREAAPRGGRPNLASLDHLWLKSDEWKALMPPGATPGAKFPMPPALLQRILRYHFVDNTRGEPPMWNQDSIKKAELSMEVESVKKGVVTLKASGSFHLEGNDLGFQGTIGGTLVYDARGFQRFDLVAVGDHWGQGTYTHGARPGKAPVGIAFVLSDGKSEADKIPPQAARDPGSYFGTE